ncbi:F0F1 ATP synthase subunit epsilon [bacterium]|nr:F0F1 ATP synthase subunit epsilon [bacterium]
MEEKKETLSLDIVTPDEHLVYQEVDEVNVPGAEGDFGVLGGHTPFLTSLRPGVLTYRVAEQSHCLAVSEGFAEIVSDRVIILAQTSEDASKISKDRAESAKERATKRLDDARKGVEGIDTARAEAALARALARLRAHSQKARDPE